MTEPQSSSPDIADNKLAAWARNWHWEDTAEDKPVDPSIYYRDLRMLKAFIAKFGSPSRSSAGSEQEDDLWLSSVQPDEISHIKTKIVDFIESRDPFGDRVSAHDLRVLYQAFADLSARMALFHYHLTRD